MQPTVAVCDFYPQLYGSQRSMVELYRWWIGEGRYRVLFLYIVEGPTALAMSRLGIETRRLPAGPLLSSFNGQLLALRGLKRLALLRELYTFGRSLAAVLDETAVDLLHCNNERAGLMSAFGARRAGTPCITHLRSERPFGRLQWLAYKAATDVIWVSPALCANFSRRHRRRRPKGHVILNGRPQPTASRAAARTAILGELALAADAKLVLMAASFHQRKGHETLIAAARIACGRNPRVCFVLAGGDTSPANERADRLQQLVRDAGLATNVRFLGYRNDVEALMAAADLLVNPSREEALGGSMIEAIGAGVPCVATDVGGTSTVVPDGQCGYLVPSANPQVLAERILEILGNPDLHSRFAANGRARFVRQFSIERTAGETAAVFDRVLRRHTRSMRDLTNDEPLGPGRRAEHLSPGGTRRR
jgi:glycosyltransferase involved in cell wall biosynthesis